MDSVFQLFKRVRGIFPQAEIAHFLGKDVRTIRRWEQGQSKVPELATAKLREMLSMGPRVAEDEAPYRTSGLPFFRFIDLFAGIGGTRLGFEAVGGKCVFTSEWNKFACQTYRANHSDDHEIAGDITKVPVAQIPEHDVLVGGFPCQPFSLAGVSKKNSLGRKHGFDDETQGTLFFNIVQILKHHRPKAFLLENVKHLQSHDKGNTFKIIMKKLAKDLGYNVSFKILNAASVVPQKRERIFIVGFREYSGFDWDSVPLPNPANGPRLENILHSAYEEPEGTYTEIFRGKTRVCERYTLTDHLWTYLQNYAKKHQELGHGFGCSVFTGDDVARTLSARYYKDGSEILISQGRKNPRRLTPRECARLMGFPDDFKIPVSDTQAYKQFGNSVVVPVIEGIADAMAACLKGVPLPATSKDEQLRLAV